MRPRRVCRFSSALIFYLGMYSFVFAGADYDNALPEGYMGKHYAIEGSFGDVKEEITFAITNRGMVINNVSHISDMLSRTGKDLGSKVSVYLHAEVIEFCSATISRRMLASDPHNIIYCPYLIAIYVLPDDPKRVHVAFRTFDRVGDQASQRALDDVEKFMEEIIQESIE